MREGFETFPGRLGAQLGRSPSVTIVLLALTGHGGHIFFPKYHSL
jgi:hypothetical protein